MSLDIRPFEKLLVAKYSPRNGCLVSDGEVLTVLPRSNVPLSTALSHHFVSTITPSLKSKFGWVKAWEPFTLDEFLSRQQQRAPVDAAARAHALEMLRSIQRLPEDTPVGADYMRRGIPPQMELSVHKVVFYCPSDR